MKKIIPLTLLLAFACEDNFKDNPESDLLFIASEGTFGDGNGSIAVFQGEEKIQTIDNVGDVVQSLLIYQDKLFVLVNNSHIIKRYSITESGLSLPGIEISTENSSPREMVVVRNKLYFTNWKSKDVKVLNLETYAIESSILIDGLPEDIVSDGNFLWVSIPNLELYDTNNGSSIVQIDINSEIIVESYEVGNGPQQMILDDNTLWISRTFYTSDWSAFYGSSRLDIETGEVAVVNYGAGTVCGGDMMVINDQVHRTTGGGVAPLEIDLSLNQSERIGSYTSLYSAGAHQKTIFMGMSDYTAPDTVLVHDEMGDLIHTFSVGVLPGDYAIWENH